eukprot:1832326-Amphidinium_carterae.1
MDESHLKVRLDVLFSQSQSKRPRRHGVSLVVAWTLLSTHVRHDTPCSLRKRELAELRKIRDSSCNRLVWTVAFEI